MTPAKVNTLFKPIVGSFNYFTYICKQFQTKAIYMIIDSFRIGS
jgi:hypothetical protein